MDRTSQETTEAREDQARKQDRVAAAHRSAAFLCIAAACDTPDDETGAGGMARETSDWATQLSTNECYPVEAIVAGFQAIEALEGEDLFEAAEQHNLAASLHEAEAKRLKR